MFKDTRSQCIAQVKSLKVAGKKGITHIEKQVEQLVDSDSPTAIKAIEARIVKLEKASGGGKI